MRIVSADYSQIELRVLAHLSQDPVLVDAFRTGQDVHTRTAMEVFGVAAERRHRARCAGAPRPSTSASIYGMGEAALAKRLGIPRAEAASFIEAYFERYERRARASWTRRSTTRAQGEAVRTLFGRRRLLPEPAHRRTACCASQAERIAQNTPIQGTAADILKLAMMRLGGAASSRARAWS